MRTVNVRELRLEIPRLRQTLEQEHELVLVARGQPIARVLPPARRRQAAPLSGHRAGMKSVRSGSEALLRQERDAR